MFLRDSLTKPFVKTAQRLGLNKVRRYDTGTIYSGGGKGLHPGEKLVSEYVTFDPAEVLASMAIVLNRAGLEWFLRIGETSLSDAIIELLEPREGERDEVCSLLRLTCTTPSDIKEGGLEESKRVRRHKSGNQKFSRMGIDDALAASNLSGETQGRVRMLLKKDLTPLSVDISEALASVEKGIRR